MGEKIFPTPEKSKEEMKRIGDELFVLQAKENSGRGVSCVRGICDYL